jgi:putative tricarboxylic transport membrane protein
MRLGSAIAAIILMIFGGFLFYLTLGFPQDIEAGHNIPGPAYFPQLLIVLMWALCLLLLLQLWRGKEAVPLEWKNAHIQIISAVAMILCISLFESVGFLIVMFVYLIFQMRLLYYKRWRTILIVSMAAVLFIYAAFVMILKVPLPVGILEGI